jgi:hypothetical protein
MATDDAAPAAEVEDNLDAIGEALMGLDESGSESKTDSENEKILNNDETSEEASDENEDADEDVENKDDDESDKDEEDDEEDDEKDDDAPVPQEKIQKRIDKLTAQKKEALEKAQTLESEYAEAKTKLAELEAQVNEASRPVLQPTADNPLADVDTPEALDAKIKSAQEVRRWALRNTDGATVKKPDGSEVYLDADQVKDYLIKADDVITVHAPARQQWLAQRQPAVEAAKNLFPDIFKKGSPMHQAYQATIKQAPELLKLPQNEYWVGLALYGEQMLMQRQEADKAKASAAKKVSSKKESKIPTPASPVSAAKSATKTSSKDAAKRLFDKGDSDSLEAFAESLLG